MPPIAIQISLVPTATRAFRELDAAELGVLLNARTIGVLEKLKTRMQQYPADLRDVPTGMRSNNLEGRQFASRSERFRGESLRSYRTRAYQMYQRTFTLRASWHVVQRGFVTQLYNNARETSRRGRGRPYAVFVHGSGDGTMPQAAQHQGRWPSLYEEFQKARVEYEAAMQEVMNKWAAVLG